MPIAMHPLPTQHIHLWPTDINIILRPQHTRRMPGKPLKKFCLTLMPFLPHRQRQEHHIHHTQHLIILLQTLLRQRLLLQRRKQGSFRLLGDPLLVRRLPLRRHMRQSLSPILCQPRSTRHMQRRNARPQLQVLLQPLLMQHTPSLWPLLLLLPTKQVKRAL